MWCMYSKCAKKIQTENYNKPNSLQVKNLKNKANYKS